MNEVETKTDESHGLTIRHEDVNTGIKVFNLLNEKELAKAKNIIGARKVSCLAVGKMDSASCEKIVKSVLGNVVAGCTASSGEEKNCLEYGLILKTEDGKLKCRLTLEEIINNLLARKREELALALFDGRLPE